VDYGIQPFEKVHLSFANHTFLAHLQRFDAGTDVTLLGKPKIGDLAAEMFNKRLNDRTKNRVLIIAFFCFLAQV